MALTPEEEAEFQSLQQEFGKRDKPISAVLKSVISPGTAIPAQIKDIGRLLSGESPADVSLQPSAVPNPLYSLQGISEGLFGGFNPYIQGGAKSLTDLIATGKTDFGQNVEQSRQLSQQAAEDNPAGVLGGQALGALFNPVSRLAPLVKGHDILGSGLLSVLQGQYQLPPDASSEERTTNAVLSGALGLGVPAGLKLIKKFGNAIFGNPNAANYLETQTPGAISAEGLDTQIKNAQQNIFKGVNNELSNGTPINVSDQVTPNTLFKEALRMESRGAAPKSVQNILDLAAELESGKGNLSPSSVQELKALYNKKANYNTLGLPGRTDKSQEAKDIAAGLRRALYSNAPVGQAEGQYATGSDIGEVINKVIRTPAANGSLFNGLGNLANRELSIPLASLLLNQKTGPLIETFTNPKIVGILGGLLSKKVSE